MRTEQPILRLVDEDGVVTEQACPYCAEKEDALQTLERKFRATAAEVTRLKRDQEKEAREHHLWDEAETAHEWWKLATGHFGVRFGADEFYQCLPRLRERDGLMALLKAIAGAAYDPGSKTMRNGNAMVFDDWELITRSKAKALNFALRVPGGADSEAWKRWLLERIDGNLQGKKKGAPGGAP